MDELMKTFHIEVGMLLAQLVNFLIVFLVLYKFAYGPIIKVLQERTRKIEKGLQDAEQSHKKLAEISEKETAVLVEARKQAQEIIKKAEESAMKNAESILVLAKEQSKGIMEAAEKQIDQEKAKILSEVKSEISDLIVMAAEKIIKDKLNNEKDIQIIKDAIKEQE